MFKLSFNDATAAFRGEANEIDEVAYADEFKTIAERVLHQLEMGSREGTCIDSNGNNVGTWSRRRTAK